MLKRNVILKGTEQGWHGDPEGHAEAARARWGGAAGAGSDIATKLKPKPTAVERVGRAVAETSGKIAGEALKDVGRAAKVAGRAIADFTGETIADYSNEAILFGSGYLLHRVLSGKTVNPAELGKIMVEATKEKVDHVMNLKQSKKMAAAIRTSELSAQARKLAQLAERGGKAAIRTGGPVGRVALRTITKNPKVAAFVLLATALSGEAFKLRSKAKSRSAGKPKK